MPSEKRTAFVRSLLDRDGGLCGIHIGGCHLSVLETDVTVDHILPKMLIRHIDDNSLWKIHSLQQPMHKLCNSKRGNSMERWFTCQCHYLYVSPTLEIVLRYRNNSQWEEVVVNAGNEDTSLNVLNPDRNSESIWMIAGQRGEAIGSSKAGDDMGFFLSWDNEEWPREIGNAYGMFSAREWNDCWRECQQFRVRMMAGYDPSLSAIAKLYWFEFSSDTYRIYGQDTILLRSRLGILYDRILRENDSAKADLIFQIIQQNAIP